MTAEVTRFDRLTVCERLANFGVATAVPGQVLTYTINVGNAGSNDVNGATVSDTLPSGLTGVTWTCAAAGGASCGSSSGAVSISETVSGIGSGTSAGSTPDETSAPPGAAGVHG